LTDAETHVSLRGQYTSTDSPKQKPFTWAIVPTATWYFMSSMIGLRPVQLSRHREEQLTARNFVPLVVAHEEDLVPVSGDAVAEPYLHHRSNTTVRTSQERL
jgi:hypothetical protein